MGFQESLEDVNAALQEFVERAREYFGQLDSEEQYAWLGEGVGFLTFATGIVLWII